MTLAEKVLLVALYGDIAEHHRARVLEPLREAETLVEIVDGLRRVTSDDAERVIRSRR